MKIKGEVHCFFEQWRDVVGYEGIYQVSNLGNVRSLNHFANTGNNGKKQPELSPQLEFDFAN